MRNGLVEGKVALVTGAGSGIGRATALKFIKEGAKVVVVDHDMEGGAETLEMVKNAGGEGIFLKADVSIKDDVEAAVRKTIEFYGQLDCAHNNAGIGGSWARLANSTEEDWDHVMGVNLKGVWHCMRAEIAQMLKHEGGAIVNTASSAGLVAFKFMSDYVTSKHGVVGLTRVAALDYATRGIRVNCVCPGLTNTPILAPLLADDRIAVLLPSVQPMNRLAEPEEIANAVVWLCSDEASFVNGQALAIDGGATIEVLKLPSEITDMIP